MKYRKELLLELRPNIKGVKTNMNTKEIESFQNYVLRPILKFQNELLLESFMNHARQHKDVFFKLPAPQQKNYIYQSVNTNQKFRSKLIVMVIALFTIEEYRYYILNLSALNKRIISMLIQRLESQLNELNDVISVEISRE